MIEVIEYGSAKYFSFIYEGYVLVKTWQAPDGVYWARLEK